MGIIKNTIIPKRADFIIGEQKFVILHLESYKVYQIFHDRWELQTENISYEYCLSWLNGYKTMYNKLHQKRGL